MASAVALVVAIGVIAGVVAITVLRADDTALLHSARNASDWGHHVVRVEMAGALEDAGLPALLSDPRKLWEWILQGDQDFPPLLHVVASVLGSSFGHDSVSVQRIGLWWLVLLCFGVGWTAWNIAGRAADVENPGSRPSRMTVACAAAAATALIPAHHAAALNYYYDLPMTALLWFTAAAVLALSARSPVLPGLVGGLGVFVAGLMKWTALPASVPLMLGVLATGAPGQHESKGRWLRFPLRRRILTAVLGATTILALLLLYCRQSPRSWNRMLSMTYGTPLDPASDFPAVSWLSTLSTTVGRGLSSVSIGNNVSAETLIWYPLRFIFSYASPLLSIALACLFLVWLLRGARGGVLVSVTAAAHGLLLFVVFTSHDERFLLTVGPLAALVAAMGWAGLPGGLRQGLALALVALGLGVAWDFHHTPRDQNPGPGHATSEEPTSAAGRIWAEIDHERRGWGLQSAVDSQWGWTRADQENRIYFPNRELLWRSGLACGATVVLAQEDLMDDGYGDVMWWRYRMGLARVQSSSGFKSILGFEGDDVHGLAGESVDLDQAVAEDRVVAMSRGDGSTPASGPLFMGWEVRAVLDRDEREGPSHLSLWAPIGSTLCGQWTGAHRLRAQRLSEPLD
ncbi:MAG: hypothetical protein CL928_06755 [Deltaproteobacteria bacterium]|nr:hypothetical protein [Deltaproteobacteria bacterium]